MASNISAVVRSSLRTIVRHVRALPSSSVNLSVASVFREFKNGINETDNDQVELLRQRAQDVAMMMKSIAEKRVLIDIYAGEKMNQAERMKLSAHRVGLRMPEQYDENSLKKQNSEVIVKNINGSAQ